MNLNLNNKVALVCGASKGLGQICASALAQEGAQVVICARNEETLTETARTIQAETGTDVEPVVCDLTNHDDIQRLVATTIDKFSTIDILITNAPHPKKGDFLSLSEEDWQFGFESVLLPVIRLCNLVIPTMQKKQWGRIIHLASHTVKEPSIEYLISSIFRTGVASLSKSLATQFSHQGILVNTVCTGLLFRTPLGEAILEQRAEQAGKTVAQIEAYMGSRTAIGRLGEIDEFAGLVTFLCSQQASYITGQAISVDGGMGHGLF